MPRPVFPFTGQNVRRSTLAAPRRAARRRPLLAGLALTALAGGVAAGLATGTLDAAPSLGQVAATPTPTPMTIRIATAAGATATPTPRVIVIVRSTASPRPTRTATPTATATPRPTSTPTPTATPTPLPVARLDFTAEDWVGGYYRGDSLYYGRPWVAVYGAFSEYPRAALGFELGATPRGPATLTITGLDDEWTDLNEIALEVNGQRVFAGPSPFVNWDGIGTGADAAWTAVAFTLPADLLRPGSNEVAVANLTPSANFGTPPYVLLAETTLEVAVAELTAPIVVDDEAEGP